MQIFEVVQKQQYPAGLQAILDLADQVAAISPDMRVPELEGGHLSTGQLADTGDQASGRGVQVQLSALDRAAQKDAAVLSIEELHQKYGQPRADKAIKLAKSQAPTAQQAYALCEREIRAAHAKRGKTLQALPNPPMHHSVKDYTHVIVTQLDLLQDGAIPSVSAVVNAAFPDDPKKATSIQNSQHGKRRKQAWASPEVVNHPMEIAMQHTHGRHDINRRLTARTLGQSLSMNAALFKGAARITKLEARVQLLEQQMRETKAREALADAGCFTSREKVLALSSQGKGPTEIARELGMNRDTVRKALQRARKAA